MMHLGQTNFYQSIIIDQEEDVVIVFGGVKSATP